MSTPFQGFCIYYCQTRKQTPRSANRTRAFILHRFRPITIGVTTARAFVYITFAIKSNIIYKLYNYEVTEYYILFIYDYIYMFVNIS